jgi:hypothetical protein
MIDATRGKVTNMDALEMIRLYSDEFPKDPKHTDIVFLHGHCFVYSDEHGWLLIE